MISVNLRQYRNGKRLPQRRVAEFAGCSLKSYQSYEEGRAYPPLPVLLKLKDLYALGSVEDLENPPAENPKKRTIKDVLYDKYLALPKDKREIIDFILANNQLK